MKRVALLLVIAILIAGCAKEGAKFAAGGAAKVYFVADTPRGFRLFSENRAFPKSVNLGHEIISELVSGKIAPLDPSYANLWGSENKLNSITSSDAIATIDLATISLNVGAEGEQRAIDQIVWTYLEFNTAVKAVRFTVNGMNVESFAGHVDTTKEFTRAPEYDVLNPLQISSINEGDFLSNAFEFSGEACTFEANVYWRLSQAGKQLEEGSTTASAACPERSGWHLKLNNLEPGTYKLEVIEYSAEDGSLFAIDDKNFFVK